MFATNDPIERACALKAKWLVRLFRGHDPKHSEDVTIVPHAPNYSGSFEITSHSGPWHYLQNVPLLFYGPGQIAPSGVVEGAAGLNDVYATVGELTEMRLEPRESKVLETALDPSRTAPPRLVVVIMWDGVGRNVLERWPDAWPNLARLEREGTSFIDATVGSSPSITPATHATLGTGTFPRTHGVTAIQYRSNGEVREIFDGRDPSDLKLTTFADQIDQDLNNESIVGMMAWKSWHLGMMGHGAQIPGGDHDQMALIGRTTELTGNDEYYSTPEYLRDWPGLEERLDETDRLDGQADGKWMGHDVKEHASPAWVRYEADALEGMLEREGYGTDDVTDLLFTNVKMADLVGHEYGMDSREMETVLGEEDAALGRLVRYLEKNIEDFVVILSSDHGHTPSARRSGAWAILQGELAADIDAHFGAPEGESLVEVTTAAGPFLDRALMREMDVTGAEVAEFLNGYTIGDNWSKGPLPARFADRASEPVLSAAFARSQYPEVMRCKFGAPHPPAYRTEFGSPATDSVPPQPSSVAPTTASVAPQSHTGAPLPATARTTRPAQPSTAVTTSG